jgi:adenylylsulfate kinase
MNPENLTRQISKVSQQDIELANHHKGAIIWLTGLSGSGKSSIAIEAELRLFQSGYKVYILDGDNLRLGLNNDLGFSAADRKENIRRVAEVACLFYRAGFIVICSFISPFKVDRDFARSLVPYGRFFEVFIQCHINECIRRDPKQLYKKAIANNLPDFTGISSPYETPADPELILNTELLAIDESANRIIDLLNRRHIIG